MYKIRTSDDLLVPMPCHCQSAIEISQELPDLAGMIATLGSYDRLFGPRHTQTLSLAARIAEVLSELGEMRFARRLFERVVRDLACSAGRTHATRLSALERLRDLLRREGDTRGACAAQMEIAECWSLLAGDKSDEAIAARLELGTLLMLSDPAAA